MKREMEDETMFEVTLAVTGTQTASCREVSCIAGRWYHAHGGIRVTACTKAGYSDSKDLLWCPSCRRYFIVSRKKKEKK